MTAPSFVQTAARVERISFTLETARRRQAAPEPSAQAHSWHGAGRNPGRV